MKKVSNEIITLSEVNGVISGHVVAVGGHFGLLKKAVRNLIDLKVTLDFLEVVSVAYSVAYEEHNISTFNKYSGYYKKVMILTDKEEMTKFINKLDDTLSLDGIKEADFIAMLPKIRKEGGGAKQKVTINDKLQKAEETLKELQTKKEEAEALILAKQEAEAKKEALKQEQKLLKEKQEAQKAEEARLALLSPKDRKKEEALKAKQEAERAKEEAERAYQAKKKLDEALQKEEAQSVLSIVSILREMSDDTILIKVSKMPLSSLKGLNEVLSYLK